MYTEQQELLKLQTNANQANKSNSSNEEPKTLTEKVPITGTPFWSIKKDDEYILVMGRYKMSPACESHEDVITYLKNNHWEILINVISIMISETK